MGKRILIVFAHPDRNSLNGAILDATISTLHKQGHEVTVSDLCKMKFDPISGPHDIVDPPAGEYRWGDETKRACAEGRLAPYIHDEQRKVDVADLLIFQFPMYFLSFPAVMKGWVDKVCSDPYGFQPPHKVMENGCLKGKKVVLSFTVGASAALYTEKGMYGDINVHLWPMQAGFRFLGLDILAPNIAYSIPSKAVGEKFISAWSQRLEGIFSEEPLYFCPLSDFSGPELNQEAIDRVASKGVTGATVGQNLGKALPKDSMKRRVSF